MSQVTPQGTYKIAYDGDVIFALRNETKLVVSSVTLSQASPVFHKWLGTNFEEGQDARSAYDPKEIPLPDDDAEAVRLLCELTHFRAGMGSTSNAKPILEATKEILRLAVVVDKYDCIEALHLASSALLNAFRYELNQQKVTLESVADLAAAAYLFRQDDHFAFFTRRMILDYTEPFSPLVECESGEMMPSIAFCMDRLHRDSSGGSLMNSSSGRGGAKGHCPTSNRGWY